MLTEQERLVLEDLSSAWHRFVELKDHCSWDHQEFSSAIHAAQSIIGTRVARRVDPDIWIQPTQPKEDPTPEETAAWLEELAEEIKKDEVKVRRILENKRKQRIQETAKRVENAFYEAKKDGEKMIEYLEKRSEERKEQIASKGESNV